MKGLFVILLFLGLIQLKAQEADKNFNFALINFDLTDSKLTFEDQELFLSALLSLGDKDIVLEEIFKRLLKSEDFTTQDSILQIYLNDYSQKEIKALKKYAPIVNDEREIGIHTVRIAYMGKSYLDSISLSEAYLNIHKDQPKFFPNIPKESFENDESVTNFVKKYYDYSKWVINYPGEFEYFTNLLKQQTFEFYNSSKDNDVLKFANHIKRNAINNNSVDEQNIPPTLDFVIEFYEKQKVRTLKFVALCNPENIDQFIGEAYHLIFRTQIPENSLLNLSKYISENNLYDPELIYLSILLSKYE